MTLLRDSHEATDGAGYQRPSSIAAMPGDALDIFSSTYLGEPYPGAAKKLALIIRKRTRGDALTTAISWVTPCSAMPTHFAPPRPTADSFGTRLCVYCKIADSPYLTTVTTSKYSCGSVRRRRSHVHNHDVHRTVTKRQ